MLTSQMVLRGGVEPPSKPYKDSALTVVLTEYMAVSIGFEPMNPEGLTV